MASSWNEDTWGCVIAVVVVLGGGWWLYDKYEIRERDAAASPTPVLALRPSGLIEVTTLADGSIWRLDADSLTGPRDARQFWIKADHSANSKVTARETQTLYRVNCDTTAYRVLKVVDYDKEGRVQNSWGSDVFSQVDDYPPPDSVIGGAIRAGCNSAYDPPVATPEPTPSQK